MTSMERADLDLEGLIHDLNNVFQTIGESAELLQTDPKWSKLGRTLQRNAVRGQRLVRSIVEGNRAPAEPSAVIETAIQFARDYLSCMRGPVLGFTREVEPDFQLAGNSAAWERVLVNLFLNSAEAGARNVAVSAAGVELLVTDDGPGIAADLLPRIFEPHVSTKSIYSGLGLYVVRSIVEQHGGTVTAGNRTGGGAEFRIRVGE